MTTLTLQVENPSILAHLKAVLKAMQGVKVLSNENVMTAGLSCTEDIPNDITLAAMKEAASGKDAGIVSTESLEEFIGSMK